MSRGFLVRGKGCRRDSKESLRLWQESWETGGLHVFLLYALPQDSDLQLNIRQCMPLDTSLGAVLLIVTFEP